MYEDKRPEPKPRKHMMLWQTYLLYDELVNMRVRHKNRMTSAERGKSNFDAQTERDFMDMLQLDQNIKKMQKSMVNFGKSTGPIWDWITAIKGMKAGTHAARVIAQIDDISKFDMVSKLWRFAGMAVIDGEAERNKKGQVAKYNNRLKSALFLVVDSFIKQQTPGYADYYYEAKRKYRDKWPEKVKNPNYRNGSGWPYLYTDMHIHRMAMRKVAKLFLQHLWVTWRQLEGLPVTMPYIFNFPEHTHYIPPFHTVEVHVNGSEPKDKCDTIVSE